MNDLLRAHRHASSNRAEIDASRLCGCFHCVQVFPATEIVAWSGLDMAAFENPDASGTGEGETALCPRCGSDTVLGDKSGFPIGLPFLGRMNEAWCQKTLVRKPPPKK